MVTALLHNMDNVRGKHIFTHITWLTLFCNGESDHVISPKLLLSAKPLAWWTWLGYLEQCLNILLFLYLTRSWTRTSGSQKCLIISGLSMIPPLDQSALSFSSILCSDHRKWYPSMRVTSYSVFTGMVMTGHKISSPSSGHLLSWSLWWGDWRRYWEDHWLW